MLRLMRSDCGFAVAEIGSGERTREPIARWGGTLTIAESPIRSRAPRPLQGRKR